MNFKRSCILSIIVMGICFHLTSCSSKSLKDQRAQQEIEYILEPGAQVDVEQGVATLTGTFASEEKMKEAEQTAKSTKGVKSVVNKASIAHQIQTAADTTSVAP